ncbi:hypothetical protein ALC56_06357 [Trachymyrmex septentrionalis]|uniref:Uncharacterized protein n=1 Tax=Trachymyrmex septentrionalis TaxID=34720 RepID=A0A195FF18_9HYME|nr:hypothetical protein ALC56_06357 [Trachymyrmex septentrionalis]
MWVAWLVRPGTKTRWFLPLEIHDSQLCSPIDLHDPRYLRDLPRPGKRNANSVVANVDMREIIRPLERRLFSRRKFTLSLPSLHISLFAYRLGSTRRYFRRCCLFPISLATNGEIPEKLRFHPNVDAGGVFRIERVCLDIVWERCPGRVKGIYSVVKVIFALSLSTSAAANSLVDDDDDDDDDPLLTPLESQAEISQANFFQ